MTTAYSSGGETYTRRSRGTTFCRVIVFGGGDDSSLCVRLTGFSTKGNSAEIFGII